MTHWKTYLLAALAGIVLLWGGLKVNSRVERWLQRKAALEQQVVDLTATNAVLQDSLTKRGGQIARRDTVIKIVRQQIAAEPIPDTCRAVVALRDDLIAQQDSQIGDWKRQFSDQKQVSQGLRVVLDSALAVVRAAPVKPTIWQLLKPEFRVTAGPGYDPLDKSFHPVVITAGLSWRLPV